MIQFRSQMPFDGPWAALVKTIVMMTSEFDYTALFDEEHSEQLATSLIIVRIIFLIFLILAAIVLMNLLVGVAVNDINDLELLGNIRRLIKQVEFLGTLDTLVYNKVFTTILPRRVNQSLKRKRKVTGIMVLSPGKSSWRYSKLLPTRLKDAIFNKAQLQKKQTDDEQGLLSFNKKLNDMHDILTSISERKKAEPAPDLLKYCGDEESNFKIKIENLASHLNELETVVADIKKQTITQAEESKSSIATLNMKVDQISSELRMTNMFLLALEKKLAK